MKPIEEKRFTYFVNNNLIWSKAYQILTKSAQNLLWCFVAELRFTGSRKKKNFAFTNNGRISFSEREFKFNRLGSSQTYLNARNQLIEVGFVKLTYRGGMARGDLNQYQLLFTEDVPHIKMRWEEYPSKNWGNEIPKAKNTKVGVKTRFKKKSSTLKNYTHNDVNSPNELDPISTNSPKNLGSK